MNVWIRLWFAMLIVADRLLGTRLVERELARLQRRIEGFETQAASIRSQMGELNRLLYASQVEFCVLYLRRRRLRCPDTWLRFVPTASAADEKDLDLLIGQLVKHGLATARTEAIGEVGGRSPHLYAYHLCPDWAAITDLLSSQEEYLDATTLSWLKEIQTSIRSSE